MLDIAMAVILIICFGLVNLLVRWCKNKWIQMNND